MANPSTNDLPLPPAIDTDRSLVEAVVGPVKRLAFWAAIALPFLHLPLLATGLQTQTETVAFVILLTLNVATLVVGHYHE